MNKLENTTISLVVSLYREGRESDARELLLDTLKRATDADTQVSAVNNLVLYEQNAERFTLSLNLLLEISDLVDSCNDWNKGQFCHCLAYTWKKIADREGWMHGYDRALIKYAEAGHYFEKSGQVERLWSVENNLGNIQIKLGGLEAAHQHFDKATQILELHGGEDKQARLAEVCDSRALAYEAQGRAEDAFYTSLEAQTRAKGCNEPRLIQSLLETHLRLTESLRVSRETLNRVVKSLHHAGVR